MEFIQSLDPSVRDQLVYLALTLAGLTVGAVATMITLVREMWCDE